MDALRGVAVLAVVVYHHDPELVPGGFLGVSLFFTLSGFLITTLLLSEHDATGTIRLGNFWVRRVRRLAPVGLIGLGLALTVGVITHPATRMAGIAGDVRAAVFHIANWRAIAGDVGYGDTFNLPSPVTHYWSLSIEEQFYAVYPVLAMLALKRSRRALVAVLLAVGTASLLRQLSVDPNRAYLGTDTRALELAIGAGAALVWARWRDALRGRALDVVSVGAFALLVGAAATVELADDRLWRGGIAVHAVLAAVVVLGAIAGRLRDLGRLRSLVQLGKISYGIYVVHYPLFLLVDADRTGLEPMPLLISRVAATLVVAGVVHVLVEQPVRVGGLLPRWQGPMALASAMAITVIVATSVPHVRATGTDATTIAAGGATVVTMPPAPADVPAMTTAAPAPAPVDTTAPATPVTGSPVTDAAVEQASLVIPVPTPVVEQPRRLLVVGDSSTEFIGAGMQAWAERSGAHVDLVYEYACTLLHEGEYLIRQGWVYRQTDACARLIDGAVAVASQRDVDAIVLFAGNFQVASWRPLPSAAFVGPGDPVYDARVLAAVSDAVRRLAGAGVPVLVADLPVPAWDADTPTPSGSLPGSGPPTINDPDRVARHNALVAEAVALETRARLLPWAAILAGADGIIDADDRVDGLHVDPDVAEALMDGALGAAIDALSTEVASLL